MFAFNHLRMTHEHMSTTFSPATLVNHTYQYQVLFPLHTLDLQIGKGHWVIKSMSTHTRYYTALQLTQSKVHYNGNVALAHGYVL